MKEFPPFRLDTVNQCLWRRSDNGGDERLLLKPTPYAILRYLVDHAGRLVTQDELLDVVWPDTHVQPDVLKRHLLEIRNALGDDPRHPTFIETLPRRGYQFVARVREDASGKVSEPVRQGQSILVGRRRALGELRECLRKAAEGQRQIVFVTGEPGIGKTSLVDEFQRLAGADAAVRHARGQCVEGYGGKEAYYPMLEALGTLCRRPGGDSIVQVLGLHAPTWLVQFPALVTREQRETLRRELLGATRERMLREIGEALETIAAATPLLLILEDLHWVDPSTVDLISALARGRAPAKLMLIGKVWLSCWTIRRECDRTECQAWPKSRRCYAEDSD
jgi:DNA-binding winged helix-turn-helix (wHTH) protein